MGKFLLEIEVLRAGQPKAYADNVFEAVLTFSGAYNGTWTPARETVLKYVKACYYENFYAGEGQQEPYQTYLDSLEQIADNQWRVIIVSPSTD